MVDHWFTSDTHFGHKNILNFCKHTRPFDCVEQMNEALIESWNNRVKPEDQVYHLGDFSFAKREETENILKRLNGNIHLIKGNHDKLFHSDLKYYLASYQPYKTIKEKVLGKQLILFHFPIEVWDRQDNGSVHLHGHTHGGYTSHVIPYKVANRLDVGIDTRDDYSPYSWDEIKECLII